METSEKQLIANRTNALLSTGPITIEGKLTISQNAFKHGLTSSKFLVLPQESALDYEILLEQLKEDFQISTGIELVLVEKIAQAVFKKTRLARYEQALIDGQRQKKEVEKQEEFYKLGKEVNTLKKLLDEVEGWIEIYQKATTPKRKKKELEYLKEELNGGQLEKLKMMAETFLEDSFANEDAFRDVRVGKKYSWGYVPKTKDGDYLRKIYCTFNTIEHFLKDKYFYGTGFEELKKIVQTRKDEKEQELNRLKKMQEIEKELGIMESSLVLNDVNLEKIKRYEAFLDNSIYKALSELEKLQIFFSAKK